MKTLVVTLCFLLLGFCMCAKLSRTKRLSRLDDAVVTWSMMNDQVNKLMAIKKELMKDTNGEAVKLGDRVARDADRNTVTEGPWAHAPVFVRSMFEGGDANSDSSLTWNEFISMYDRYDTNRDQHVSKAEFLNEFLERDYGDRTLATVLFVKGDLNRNEELDGGDLGIMFDHFDTNGDGKVSSSEFARLWKIIISRSIAQSPER